jgi:hypothetical protein
MCSKMDSVRTEVPMWFISISQAAIAWAVCLLMVGAAPTWVSSAADTHSRVRSFLHCISFCYLYRPQRTGCHPSTTCWRWLHIPA